MWALDPERRHLNHGSFGATPLEVLAVQSRWRQRLEANPTGFMVEELPQGMTAARAAAAAFLGCDPDGLVFVRNASTGVASVLRSLEPTLASGDEIITTSHDYNAVRQMLRFLEERVGVVIRVAEIPFPITGQDVVTEAVLGQVSERTSLVIVDHITSPTGLVLPVAELTATLEPDIPVLIDGAHGPGQVALDLGALGASWYTGNLHKWVCAPKGAGFLRTRADRVAETVPPVISHGWNASVPEGSSRYRMLFDWLGTDDFTSWLAVPDAIQVVGDSVPGGWAAVMKQNHELVMAARDLLCNRLGVAAAAPAEMVGTMATLHLPQGSGTEPDGDLSPLMADLHAAGFETLVLVWPTWPDQILRISAHVYNRIEEYEALADALEVILPTR